MVADTITFTIPTRSVGFRVFDLGLVLEFLSRQRTHRIFVLGNKDLVLEFLYNRDPLCARLEATYQVVFCFWLGNCVTGIGEDQVCRLNSMSTGCSEEDEFATIDCLCKTGVVDADCQG